MDEYAAAMITQINQNIERWLILHMEHYPGPRLEIHVTDPPATKRGVCSCGERVLFTWSITVV